MRRAALALVAALSATAPGTAAVQQSCDGVTCQVRLTPAQLLAATERLVGQHRYAEARPLLAVLARAPGLALQTRYLTGLVAARTGDSAAAVAQFEAILADDPRQTQVRLELAQALMALRRTASADRQLRIAQQDADLPPEIARTIRTVRDTIRSGRAWRLDFNAGLAPDTNINNATSARAITVLLGDNAYRAELSDDAKAHSGLGQTALLSAGLRLPLARRVSLLGELDASGTNYRGTAFDDYTVQAATGAEYRLGTTASVSLEGVAARRWYGGRAIVQQAGARTGGQLLIGKRDRIGYQIDLRHQRAFFDPGYDGWQGGVYATLEHALSRTFVASASPFVRREWLREDFLSDTEVGGTLGFGGEARHGFNVGASASLSRATFDAAIPIFGPEPRRDTRLTLRATLGNRKIRVLGFSPQVNWTWNRFRSTVELYSITRSRFELTLARYF